MPRCPMRHGFVVIGGQQHVMYEDVALTKLMSGQGSNFMDADTTARWSV